MADTTNNVQLQTQALADAMAKASEIGTGYIYTETVTEDGQSITGSFGVSVRWLDQNRFLYCDSDDSSIADFKAEHPSAVRAGYIVYESGSKPDFITNADKWVDNNIDVFMRKGHYEGAAFEQTPVPSYIDGEYYDGENYDTNGNDIEPLYYVSDEIKLDENE